MRDLPLWFRIALVGMLALLLVFNVVFDALATRYDGGATSIALIGFLGGSVAEVVIFRGRRKDGEEK